MATDPKPLAFEGHSDDTFGEYARTFDDYDNCANGDAILWRVWSPGEQRGMLVWGQYGGAAWPPEAPPCWMIGVQQVEEDAPLPIWPVRLLTGDHGYSPRLEIDAPADADLRCLNRSHPGGDR